MMIGRTSTVLLLAVLAVAFTTVECTERYTGKFYSCDPAKCDDIKNKDCLCAHHNPPGGLKPEDVPQFITITADDDVSETTYPPMKEITQGHSNMNSCPIPVTYFVSIRYTEMDLIQQLHDEGNEIATHTIGHVGNPGEGQIVGARDALKNETSIPESELIGFRAPFLKSTPKVRKLLWKHGFTYDSSLTEQAGDDSRSSPSLKEKLWPYTMDFGIAQNCENLGDVKCNSEEKYPGLWEIPMLDLQNEMGLAVASMDPVNGDAYDLYKRDFVRSLYGNKAPFGIYIHPAWLLSDHSRVDSLNKFLAEVTGIDDVWVVTNTQLLDYMRNPMNKADYRAHRAHDSCASVDFVDANMDLPVTMDVDPDAVELPAHKKGGKRKGKKQGNLGPNGKRAGKAAGAVVEEVIEEPVVAVATSYEMPSNLYSCTVWPNNRRTGGGLVGGDIMEQVQPFIVSLNSVQECLKACHDEPTCEQYVFVVPSQICYRMTQLSADDGEYMDGYVSGGCHQTEDNPKTDISTPINYDPEKNYNGAMVDPTLPHNEEAEKILKEQVASMWKPWSPENATA